MTHKQQRFVLFKHFKMHYNVILSDAQLDDIQDIFHDLRRQSIFNVGFYRFINFALSCVVICIWFFIPDENMKWFFLVVWIVFAAYNFFHFGVTYVQFRRVKMPKRESDV